MTIALLRHNKVKLPFLKGMATQSQVLEWFGKYNTAEVEVEVPAIDRNWDICYTSNLKRAKETGIAISIHNTVHTDLLNEPFPNPLFKSNPKLPFLLWGLLIKLAILNNHSSQSQGKNHLVENLNKFISIVERQEHSKVLVVSHSFTIRLMSQILISKGYRGRSIRNPSHGKVYLYKKEEV